MDPTNLVQYASRELKLAGILDSSDKRKNEFAKRILSLCVKFREYKMEIGDTFHVLNILQRVARFMPLTPLTGEDSEWHKSTHPKISGVTHQNTRFFNVFKHSMGMSFQSDGYKVYRPDKSFYFAIKDVKFPYIPSWETISEEEYKALPQILKTQEHEIVLQSEATVNPNTDTPEI